MWQVHCSQKNGVRGKSKDAEISDQTSYLSKKYEYTLDLNSHEIHVLGTHFKPFDTFQLPSLCWKTGKVYALQQLISQSACHRNLEKTWRFYILSFWNPSSSILNCISKGSSTISSPHCWKAHITFAGFRNCNLYLKIIISFTDIRARVLLMLVLWKLVTFPEA